jgi:N4-gp56 family major capsid protein
MATGVIGTNHQTTTTGANFIPELWSDETIAAYKSNLVVANLVTRLNHKGKEGDTIHIPTPVRGSATAKAANTKVYIQGDTHSVTNLSIDKHYEYSVLIEDITEVQALSSLRKFYTDDAGYALAKQVDTHLLNLSESAQSGGTGGGTTDFSFGGAYIGNATTAWSGTNEADITDAGIRAFLLKLDNADVPMDNRSLIIPPVAANDMLGIARFTEQQFIGSGDAIRTGKIGQIYGVDVYISTNCPTCKSGGGTGDGGAGTERVGVLMHKDAWALAEQVGVRSQTQYQQQYLGDLFTSDTIYGIAELRDDAVLAFVVPAS